ncbi:uncharacterized protein LOC114531881 isoform X1 [Dendronephthya gigantea]|uniref:uncharacterized protein LOC114531881 isoform X1 n=1 Tax=Dendronephthya gigantea TaxID=151771 RepID=UPI00106C85E2|nr:uncharacterized protein LOC114531881 isoform X1 [Dendronephthya gigantea]
MSRKSAGKRKKNEDEHLDSIIDEINTITGAESSKSRKTRPDHSSKNKDIDIVLRRDESGQRIYHNPRRLSQSSWARRVEYTRLNEPVDLLTDKVDEHSETFEQGTDLDAIIEQCEEAVGEMNDNTTVWQKRINNLEENWENARGAIFHSVLCSFAPPTSSLHCSKIDCPNDAQLRCKQCGVFQYLCVNCDEEVHQCQPLHDREVWINGYFQYILPTESITDDGKLVPVGRACPLLYPTSCLVCGESTLKTLNSSKVILITSEGRFDLNWFNIHCSSCPWQWSPISFDCIVQSGFWPGSPANVNYLFHQELFLLWDAFRKQMPGSSQTAFIRSLEDMSRSKKRADVITAATFRKAFAEWCYCQFELASLQLQDWRKCPPCSVDQHSCHIDGNHKVYRYDKVSRGTSPSYYNDHLIVENAKVDSHIRSLNSKITKKDMKEDSSCGDTHWKAAKAVSKAKKNQDETGLVVAGCRHSVCQAALNMFRGEVYGYAHYLHLNFVHPNNVRFLWEDVICKYWPWAKRVTSEQNKMALTDTKPALSLMHGKSHSWNCQVIWSGRWQEGAAATPGEEVEQINSYLSRLGSTTKNMIASGREDCITEHLLSWNKRKICNLPKLLVLRLKKTEKKLADAKTELATYAREINLSDADLDASVVSWKRDVQQFATGSEMLQRRFGKTSPQFEQRLQALPTSAEQLWHTFLRDVV